MARDSSGPKNVPQYAGTGAPADAADLTEVAAYAAAVGNRKSGTTIQMNALLGTVDAWDGLFFGNTTDGFEYRHTAGAWVRCIVRELGWVDRGTTPSDLVIGGAATWTDVTSVTLTATAGGGPVEVEWEAVAKNYSGTTSYYEVLFRILFDGVSTGGERNFSVPGVSGLNPSYGARGRFQHTPAAGSHTWKLQHYCGAATVAGTKFATLKLTER